MPPHAYLVGGVQLFARLQPLNFVTRHAYVFHMPEPATGKILCHFGLFFALLPPLQPRKSKFWKHEEKKKMHRYITIFLMCAINENHMMYGSWNMEHNRQNFFVILDHLLPFYPLNNPENQNYKKWKKPWRYHDLTQVYQISWSYAILFLRCDTWQM